MDKHAIIFLLCVLASYGAGVVAGRAITYPEAVFLAWDLCTEDN